MECRKWELTRSSGWPGRGPGIWELAATPDALGRVSFLEEEALENNNHEHFCNDNSKTPPAINKFVNLGRFERRLDIQRGAPGLSHRSVSDVALLHHCMQNATLFKSMPPAERDGSESALESLPRWRLHSLYWWLLPTHRNFDTFVTVTTVFLRPMSKSTLDEGPGWGKAPAFIRWTGSCYLVT